MIRLLYGKLWIAGAGLIILLAALLSVARILLPYAADHHGRIEQQIGDLVGQRIDIGSINAAWHGFGPRLQLSDVSLLDAESERLLMRFEQGEIGIDLLASLLRRGWHIDRLIVSGVHLSVIRAGDGRVTVAGIEMPAAQQSVPTEGADQLLAWLLAQRRLAVDRADVNWIDYRNSVPTELHFSDVSLEMRNSGMRHQLDGSARLPELIGQRFAFAIDLRGDLLGTQDWDANAYVDGVGLRLGELLRDSGVAGMNLERGEAGVSAWGQWKDGRLAKLEGILSAADLTLANDPEDNAPSPQRVVIDAVSGRFAWQRRDDGWRVDINDFTLGRGARKWPLSDLGMQFVRGGEEAPGALMLHAGYLDLSVTAELLAMSDLPAPRQAELLKQLDPRGRVRDLDLTLAAGMGARPYAVRARFDDLTTSPWERVPGVDGLDGTIVFDDRAGFIHLDTSMAELMFPRLFRDPLPASVLQGQLHWSRDSDGWRVSAPRLSLRNGDVELLAWGGIEKPSAGSDPVLALFGEFKAATIENTSRYLPAAIMPANTVRWLDRAILGGVIPRGTLMFHGPLKSFPFDRGDGRFRIDFDVREGALDYASAWPLLDQIEANVVFDGRRMSIHAVDGRSFASTLSEADVLIADLAGHPAVLEVKGRIRGPTQDALRFLRESPLREKFGGYVRGFEAKGESHLDLQLGIPLDNVAATRVDGLLTFEDSRLTTAGGGIDIAQIKGNLRFTDAGLQARDIEARILGLPSRIDVRSEEDVDGTVTRISAAGRAGADTLVWLRPEVLRRHVKGELPWSAELRIPGYASTGAAADLMIGVDLTEAAIDLPPPLAKSPGEGIALQIAASVPHEAQRPVRLQLGEIVSGIFELDDEMTFQRGELRVGDGAAVLPQGWGLRVAGHLEHLSYSSWAKAFSTAEPAGGQTDQDESVRLNTLDLAVDSADFYGRTLHQAHIAAERKAPGWELSIASTEVAGQIVIPTDWRLPWTLDFDRLHVAAPAEDGNGEAADPRNLPAVHVKSRDFKYNAIDFGVLDLVASRRESGLHLDRLLLSAKNMRVDARGDWTADDAGQSSAFEIKFDSGNFGAALSRLGYAGTIDEGEGHFDITARWDGPPTDFALERLEGSMHMTVRDGRLLDVEPGAGRIFGLISLQALPRRLSLDFSDFFRKGFSFDRIEGNFDIKDGNATIRDLSMNGPAAKIVASGKIDLAAGEYDQTVVVTPSIASGLPVAGAIAGGVGVGAVILLMEKVFKPNIERLTKVTYRVTGRWNDPVVERLQDADRSKKR